MNIFYLDQSPVVSAQAMTNKHVVKMIVESAQLLSTAHHILDGTDAIVGIYKPTHRNHPSAVWTRETFGNYIWLRDHLGALLDEYGNRYNKQPSDHATNQVFKRLFYPPKNIPLLSLTPIKPAITNKIHIVEGDGVKSYRNYYVAEKIKTPEDLHRYKKTLDLP
jgi:hypothetical protein